MQTRYTSSHICFQLLPDLVRSRIATGMDVCEIGGGANPLLSRSEREQLRLSYTVIDIDATELAKGPEDIRKVELDITMAVLPHRFDVVISRHLAEHVRDPAVMHRNIHAMLNPGGVAIHFFPTFYSLPFIFNRAFPERLTEHLLLRVQPYRTSSGNHGKFPAYYRWCRGPTRRQLQRLMSIGFEIEEYVGGFGHAYYCHTPLLQRCEELKTRLLLRHPRPLLTSYAVVVLRRPGSAGAHA